MWTDLEAPNDKGWRKVRCGNCGLVLKSDKPHERIHCQCRLGVPLPNRGVGTELKRLLESLAIHPDSTCNCSALAAEWDRLGIAWCIEHRDDVLIPRLREAYSKTEWGTVLKAGVLAAKQGLPLTIEGMVQLAIERAENSAPTRN